MTTKLEQAARQLLEIAVGIQYGTDWNNGTHAKIYRPKFPAAITALREALAKQAEQEPVQKPFGEKWIDPNDKSQKQYLPHIGEKVLFCCDGEVYYGHHTGGSFQKGHGVTKSLFPTWDCMWMHLPAAVIAADREKNRG